MLTPLPRRVLALAALVAGLGIIDAAAISFDRTREGARAPLAGTLLSFNPTAVHKLTISRAQRTPIVLERQGAGWVVASHKGYPARAGRVDQTLQRLLGWKRERLASDSSSPAGFGVTAEHAISVKLDDAQGRPIGEVYVGSLTGVDAESARQRSGHVDPNAIGRYVRALPEEAVFVVSDFVSSEFEPDPSEWLDRPLVAGEESKVRGLSVLKTIGEGFTALLDPQDPRLADGRPVDLDHVRPLLRDVLALNPLDACAQEDDLRLGLLPPRATVDVLLEGAALPVRVALGEEIAPSATVAYPGVSPPTQTSPPVVAARVAAKPCPVLVLASSARVLTDVAAESLVLTHALAEHPEPVTRVELARGGRTIALAQEPPGWAVSVVASGTAGAPRKLEGDAGNAARARALAAVTAGLRLVGYDRVGAGATPPAHGLAHAPLRLVLELGKKDRRELAIGAAEGSSAWARRADIPCLLELPASAVAELEAAFDALPTN